MVYRLIKSHDMLVEHEKNSPQASDLRILRVFVQHSKCFIMPITYNKTCGLLPLYNNSEEARFFHEFTAK